MNELTKLAIRTLCNYLNGLVDDEDYQMKPEDFEVELVKQLELPGLHDWMQVLRVTIIGEGEDGLETVYFDEGQIFAMTHELDGQIDFVVKPS